MPQVDFKEFPRAKVFVGGCVSRGDGSSFRSSAHAHSSKCKDAGWICVRSKKPETLRLPDGEPTNLMKHEYAHILVDEGHTKKFWETLYKLGGYMDRESYFGHKKKDFKRGKWDEVKKQVQEDTFKI